jgi:16S rRNA (guanine527-N7)-methyltransferase
VGALGLDHATVVRGRAEELVPRDRKAAGQASVAPADIVTARAVAPLDRLTAWCLPLAVEGGRLLALKGESASEEVAAHRAAVLRLGGGEPMIRHCGEGLLSTPTTVVEVTRRGRGH